MEEKLFISNVMRKNTLFYWAMDGENIEYIDLGITIIREIRRETENNCCLNTADKYNSQTDTA